MSPISHLLDGLLFAMLVFFGLAVACNRQRFMLKLRSSIDDTKTMLEPHALFLKVMMSLTLSFILLGQVAPPLGSLLENASLIRFGEFCKGLSWLSALGFFWVIHAAAAGYEHRRVQAKLAALFSPKGAHINTIDLSGTSGTVTVIGGIMQNATGNSVTLERNLDFFIEAAKASNQLDLDQLTDLVSNAAILREQCSRSPEQRSRSNIMAAMGRICVLVSSASKLWEAWSKLEALIKAHLH